MELNKEERRKDKNNKKKERERKVKKCLDHYIIVSHLMEEV